MKAQGVVVKAFLLTVQFSLFPVLTTLLPNGSTSTTQSLLPTTGVERKQSVASTKDKWLFEVTDKKKMNETIILMAVSLCLLAITAVIMLFTLICYACHRKPKGKTLEAATAEAK